MSVQVVKQTLKAEKQIQDWPEMFSLNSNGVKENGEMDERDKQTDIIFDSETVVWINGAKQLCYVWV